VNEEVVVVGLQSRHGLVPDDVVDEETRHLWVVYMRYRDGRPCAHTRRPVTTFLPSYFYESEDDLGCSDCVSMVVPDYRRRRA
jgi:hypothetical protein